jgi:death on curing protein
MKIENVVFLDAEIAEEIHRDALTHGGRDGLLDRSLLISAIETPKTTFDGQPLYPSLAEMAATYVWGIVRNHPFVDGNKRTALRVALAFLETNGKNLTVGMEWVDLLERVAADHNMQRSELVTAFRHEMSSDETIE